MLGLRYHKTAIAPCRRIPYATCSGCAGKMRFTVGSSGMTGRNNGIDQGGIPKKEVGFPFLSAVYPRQFGQNREIVLVFQSA